MWKKKEPPCLDVMQPQWRCLGGKPLFLSYLGSSSVPLHCSIYVPRMFQICKPIPIIARCATGYMTLGGTLVSNKQTFDNHWVAGEAEYVKQLQQKQRKPISMALFQAPTCCAAALPPSTISVFSQFSLCDNMGNWNRAEYSQFRLPCMCYTPPNRPCSLLLPWCSFAMPQCSFVLPQ